MATLQAGDMLISTAEESKYKTGWLTTASCSSVNHMFSPHTFPVRGRHQASLTLPLQARIFRRYVTGRFTPSWEAATICRFYWKWHWQNRPPLRRRYPAGTTKRQTGPSSKTWLMCCAENLTLTTARTSTPVSSSWLNAYSRQQSRPSPEAEGRTTSPTGVTIYSAPHDQLTEARKRLEQLPLPKHSILYSKVRTTFGEEKIKKARKSWQEKTGSLNMEKDTRKLWNLTKALNGDQQHAPRAILLKEGTQIFTGKKAAYLLADSSREDSLLDISREKQADIRIKTKEQLQKQSATPIMTSEFSIHELNCATRQPKTKKAPGKDDISSETIRHLGSVAKQKLLDIYNQSWNTGTFPTNWKEAIIILILKKRKDSHRKTSCRPISLLNCLGKTMVNRRLQHHLEKNGLLSLLQSGFRKNSRAKDQVALLTQDIKNGFQ